MQNIVVISHRRSGTHLTIDAIRNNFSPYKKSKYINIDLLLNNNGPKEQLSFDSIKAALNRGGMIVKTHAEPDIGSYFGPLPKNEIEFIEELFNSSKKIYVLRDGRDVMVSFYEYMKTYNEVVRTQSFKEFLRSDKRINYWQNHVQGWRHSRSSEDILWLNYEDWIREYDKTLDRLSRFITMPRAEKTVDVRLSAVKRGFFARLFDLLTGSGPSIEMTSVEARRGTVGDYRNYFDEEDQVYFQSALGNFENHNRVES